MLRRSPVWLTRGEPEITAKLFLDFRDSGDDDGKNPVPVSLSAERIADWSSALESRVPPVRSLLLCPLPGACAGLSVTSSERSADKGEDSCGASVGAAVDFTAVFRVSRLRWDGRFAGGGGEEPGPASDCSAEVGALLIEYGSEDTRFGGFAGFDLADDGSDCGRSAAATSPASKRRLLADVFGLVRFTAAAGPLAGGAVGAMDGPEGTVSGSRSEAGGGASAGIEKRSPKSAFST